MSTATDQDTRLFRFGAIVPEAHQELALRLAELEDKLNESIDLATETSAIRGIYFIGIYSDLPNAEGVTSYEPETKVVEIRTPISRDEEQPLVVLTRELSLLQVDIPGDITNLLEAMNSIED